LYVGGREYEIGGTGETAGVGLDFLAERCVSDSAYLTTTRVRQRRGKGENAMCTS
jgi:hypothetical protein